MPFIPVPDVVQAELVYLWDNQVVETVLHYEMDTQPLPAIMTELGADLVAWWSANLRALQPTTISLINVKLTDLTTDISPVVDYAVTLPLAGTNGSPSLPNSVAVVMTKRTLLRGRSYRGRVYHPGLTETHVTSNALVAGFGATLVTAYNNLRTQSQTGATSTLCVVSRFQAGQPLLQGIATPVTTFTTDGNVDSQRRRLPGRGA